MHSEPAGFVSRLRVHYKVTKVCLSSSSQGPTWGFESWLLVFSLVPGQVNRPLCFQKYVFREVSQPGVLDRKALEALNF